MSDESYVMEASFASLVLTLSSSAWVSLGKITDPVSGEIKKDLRSAKFSIDTLIMLREKTAGHIDDDESKLLNSLISDLQANYAETVFEQGKADQAAGSEAKGDEEKKPEPKTESSVSPEGDTGAAKQAGEGKAGKEKQEKPGKSKKESKK